MTRRTVVPSYDALLAASEIDAVYIPLVNNLHLPWTLKALWAGKHVLCEKPLAMNAAEAEEMAAASRATGKVLMEAFMYRFHPRLRTVVEAARADPPKELWASFGFPLGSPDNYRFRRELGGGAVFDVGCYTINAARWIMGEPTQVEATGHVADVDLSANIELGFEGGRRAHLFASFESEEVQELRFGSVRVERPFTDWTEPDDPYRLMVEAFGDACLSGSEPPLSLQDTIANLRVIDLVHRRLGLDHHHGGGRDGGHGDHLAEPRQG
jgi:predicted dehydrogenase